MNSVWVLQHNPIETLGTIEDAIQGKGISSRYIRPFAGEPVPQTMGSAPALVVMGGPMGVYDQDRYPFLRDEMLLIEDALRLDRPILGGLPRQSAHRRDSRKLGHQGKEERDRLASCASHS